MRSRMVVLLAGLLAVSASRATAQPLGTFRWQLQPYCNVVTLAVTQVGATYRVEGIDDLCGAPRAASAIGTAFLNPDGTVGFGVTVVPPEGPSLQLAASITLAGLSGTWRDSSGFGGSFAFTAGSGTGGSARPDVPAQIQGVRIGSGLSLGGQMGAPDPLLQVDAATVGRTLNLRQRGTRNVALGSASMAAQEPTGVDNTAVGASAMSTVSGGSYNVALGTNALGALTTASHNTAVGRSALAVVDTAWGNTAVGSNALSSATGQYNTAVGTFGLLNVTAAEGNVALGYEAGVYVKGSRNIVIGYKAGESIGTGSNNIYIGSAGSALDADTIRIGNPTHTGGAVIGGIAGLSTVGGTTVLINSAGRLGTVQSSARFKDRIQPLTAADLAGLQALRPVSFVYKPEHGGSSEAQFGLIAEEVAGTMPDLVVRDEKGEPWTVRYHLLAPLLLADAQRLERERQAMRAELSSVQQENAALKARLADIEARLSSLATVSPK